MKSGTAGDREVNSTYNTGIYKYLEYKANNYIWYMPWEGREYTLFHLLSFQSFILNISELGCILKWVTSFFTNDQVAIKTWLWLYILELGHSSYLHLSWVVFTVDTTGIGLYMPFKVSSKKVLCDFAFKKLSFTWRHGNSAGRHIWYVSQANIYIKEL